MRQNLRQNSDCKITSTEIYFERHAVIFQNAKGYCYPPMKLKIHDCLNGSNRKCYTERGLLEKTLEGCFIALTVTTWMTFHWQIAFSATWCPLLLLCICLLVCLLLCLSSFLHFQLFIH